MSNLNEKFVTLLLILFSIQTAISSIRTISTVNCDDRLHKNKIITRRNEISKAKGEQDNHSFADHHEIQANGIDKTLSASDVQWESPAWPLTSGAQDAISSSGLIRLERSLGRGRLSRLPLAQRPKSTTTTTTTSSTTPRPGTSEKGGPEGEPAEEESSSEVEEEEAEEEPVEETTTRKVPMQKGASAGKPRPSPIGKPPNKSDQKQVDAKSGAGRKKPSAEKETSDNSSTTKPAAASNNSSIAAARKRKPLYHPSFIIPKNESACTPDAYLEFPSDLIGNKWRSRGLVIIHLVVVCYMFYSLALVCERYFMPSLEEFAQRLGMSQDVAGATLMSAGSSAPELFTAIMGVFVAKGDVGTGAIVGSAVFNILFVIGICAFISTTSAQLNWWPVLRDSVFYTFTVLVLILFIYDERITTLESFTMIALYGLYILIMVHNEKIKEQVTKTLQAYPVTAKLFAYPPTPVGVGPDDVFASVSLAGSGPNKPHPGGKSNQLSNYQTSSMMSGGTEQEGRVEEDSIFLASCLVVVRHKRLFRSQMRFQFAARYIICKRQHKLQRLQRANAAAASLKNEEVNYFGPESESLSPKVARQPYSSQRQRMEAYASNAAVSKNKFSIVSKDDYEFWNRPPEEGENYYLWLAKIPVNYVLHYTVPDCSLYPDKYLATFAASILWTAFFSYIMVWMVTLIGFTFGIPDSVMGVTFLAAGTSVPDCYSSVHAARNGMADMAVSNSIGSNVFDILIGLAVPWFIQSAIYPGVVATINSRGVIYSVILLFLSLVVTIYLMNKYGWTLEPRLGIALLIAYGLFIMLTCMLEFNLFGHVNPPPC